MSTYPTLEQVEAADRETLCRWWRFLPSPGMWAVESTQEEFYKVMNAEAQIMDRIAARMKEVGGFTPEISKAIGWDKPK